LPDSVVDRCWGDMRRELRFGGSWPVFLRRRKSNAQEPAILRDYSRSGFQVLTGEPLVHGEDIELVVHDVVVGKATVRWSRTSEFGYHFGFSSAVETGIELTRLLGNEIYRGPKSSFVYG